MVFFNYTICQKAIENARSTFADRLEIAFGLEVDFAAENLAEIERTLPRLPVDFVLGSVHSYQGRHFQEILHTSPLLTEDDMVMLYCHYFSEHQLMIKSGLFDAIAHLDYPALIGLRSLASPLPAGFEEEMANIIALAVTNEVALEINTRNAFLDHRITAASENTVQRYVALGGKWLTLGTDSHQAVQLARGLDIGLDIIHQAGPYRTNYLS